ncbi:MAG: SDR family NAD(P)-dependent oxidoreductase [Pseudomonadota bacterium]
MPQTPDLSGTVALVTGASRGLGRALALALGAAGAEVIALARTSGALEELDDAIRAAGGPRATLTPLDVAEDEGLANLGLAIHQRWGRIDLLVHAAAHAGPLSPAEHVDAKVWDRCFAVNARAVSRLIVAAEPLLRPAPRPRAVFFEDRWNRGAFHGAYAASKAAGQTAWEAWAAESARKPLEVVGLAPPPMATALRARFHPGEDRAKLTAADDTAATLLPQVLGERVA